MCTNIQDKITDRETITGYKIVHIKRGDIRSPITGVKYIPGKRIKRIERDDQVSNNMISKAWARPFDLFRVFGNGEYGYLFKKNFVGFTTIFETIKDAAGLVHPNVGEFIVKMTLSDDISTAIYDGDSCYVGKRVVKIQKLNRKEKSVVKEKLFARYYDGECEYKRFLESERKMK
jgi:hypothetical protein